MNGEHPFNIPLAEMSHEELEKRFADIMRRYQIARRMQMDQSILYQLDLLLNSIEFEKERRSMIDDKPSGVILDTDPITILQNKYLKK